MTIYEIKRRIEHTGDSHFFDRKTLKFLGRRSRCFQLENGLTADFISPLPSLIDFQAVLWAGLSGILTRLLMSLRA